MTRTLKGAEKGSGFGPLEVIRQEERKRVEKMRLESKMLEKTLAFTKRFSQVALPR
jgi:hypothetical protein